MRFFKAPIRSLASIALFAWVQASYLSNELSFGHNGKIAPNDKTVPNFLLRGQPNAPDILSNKIVLTPPAPGNQRGAIWSENRLEHTQWGVDVDFRATGPERGGGNLQIWYTNAGEQQVGTSSIYTVGKFDGLVLVVDQYSGSGGFIRGFLNDGSTEYKSHHSVDSLAFGHCSYAYRNLGRPSRINVQQSASSFRVNVDGNLCFESPKIRLPSGYQFGMSAASAENPDSFEVFKFVVTTESHTPEVQDASHQQHYGSTQNQNRNPVAEPGEIPASQIQSQSAQFADVHNRLQLLAKQISSLNRDVSSLTQQSSTRHSEVITQLTRMEAFLSSSVDKLATMERLNALEKKIDNMGADVRQTKADLHNSLDKHVAGLKQGIRDTHEGVGGLVREGKTGWGMLLALMAFSQCLTVVGYWIYKSRKRGGIKKYL